jgi:molecular chaperone DnaK (HSP70)
MAGLKAGIRIQQFVHEPLAALYGYLRGRQSFERSAFALEGRLVLVVDWGGGTLDLTLCQVRQGLVMQVLNVGDPEVGGDQFDLRLRRLVRQKHEVLHPAVDWSRIQPSAEARLIQACEDAKIGLSAQDSTAVYVRNVLAIPGPPGELRVTVSRTELEASVGDLIRNGLGRVEDLLRPLGISLQSIEFCLATGGMVQMPAIQEGLREMFGMNRLRLVEDGATLIAEGAAWIAYDGVPLRLAKPVELLHADDCYVELVPGGTVLPQVGTLIQTRMDLYSVDPSDG